MALGIYAKNVCFHIVFRMVEILKKFCICFGTYKIDILEIILYISLIFIRVTNSKLFQNFVYTDNLGMSIRYSLQLYCINFLWRGIMLACKIPKKNPNVGTLLA